MVQNVEILYLNQEDVRRLAPSYHDAIDIVEKVFIAHDEGKALLPPKFALDLEHIYGGHLNIMPGYLEDLDIQGIKLITAYINNNLQGLPSAMAMINLYDTRTGKPLAIMDGSLITLLRTGAATGVGVKYLAKKNSEVAGFFGAGAVAPYHVFCVLDAMPSIKEIKIFDVKEELAKNLAKRIAEETGVSARRVGTHEEAVRDSDIVVTATRMPKPSPLVKREWVKPGCFIAATGQCYELDYELPKASKIVVDNFEQCRHVHSGWGFSVLFDDKVITWDDIYGEVGEIVQGKKVGRRSEDEIIIMWARGLGTEDVATAFHVYKKAKEAGLGQGLKYL